MVISKDDKIYVLKLSTRAYNVLRRNGIATIDDLISLDVDKFINFKNIGYKTASEILDCIEKIKTNQIKIVNKLSYAPNDESTSEDLKTFIHTDGNRYNDVPIESLDLTTRAYNCLKRGKILYFSEISSKNENDFLEIPNMGKKTIQELFNIIKNTQLTPVKNVTQNNTDNFPEQLYTSIFKLLKEALELNAAEFYNEIIGLLEQYLENISFEINIESCLLDKGLKQKLQSNNYIKSQYTDFIVRLIDSHIYGCSEEFIYDSTPNILKEKNYLISILLNLIQKNKIIEVDKLYVKNRISFTDAAKSILDDREYNIFIKRTQGLTLEEIGDEDSVTRERIRQIEAKAIKKLNNSDRIFKEDIYKDIFKKYYITDDDFKIAFNNIQAYNYLAIRYNPPKGSLNGKMPLIEVLEDTNIPNFLKRRLEKAIYKDYVKIGKEYIPCTRSDITNYVLRTFAVDDISFDDFKEIYFSILDDIGKTTDDKFSVMDRGYENKLSASKNVLWKYGKKLRFYDIESNDYSELLRTLNLTQYNNVEYSSLKFFRLYPEIMRDYDIRDEYELHNLLKKICKKEEYPQITFNRTPNIEFGTANRDSQVLELLISLAPISNDKFALEYEQEYGVSANTVLANYMKNFDEYFHEKVYKIDAPMLPNIIADKLKSILTDDFYLLNEIKKVYLKEFANADIKLLNPFSVKSLGFRVYSSYAVSDKFSSATEYFNYILTKEDIFDTSLFPSNMRQLITYTSCLYKLKSNYDIVEYSLNNYISCNRLNQNGITKDMLNNYVRSALDFAGVSKFFTIHSIKKDGFSHDLDDLGFDDWFYSSLLVEHKNEVSYFRFGGTKVFFKGNTNISSTDIIEYVIYEQDSLYMDIYDLLETLEEYYGIKTESYKLIEIARNCGMFYDAISEKIYADYDTYFEEI